MNANSSAQCYAYGQYVGDRYRNQKNIIWVEGGDWSLQAPTPAAIRTCGLQVMQGIKDGKGSGGSSALQTAHWIRGQISTDDAGFAGQVNVNSVYALPSAMATLCRTAYSRAPVLPAYVIEGYYEGEHAMTREGLRQEGYWAALSCIEGYVFGNAPLWLFDTGWQTALDAPGSQDMQRMGAVLDSVAWQNLVPSNLGALSGTVLVPGSDIAQGGDVAAAASSTALVAYLPSTGTTARTITVTMSVLGAFARGRWYNPASGVYSDITGGAYSLANSGTHAFTTPGNNGTGTNDWVLVLDATTNPSPVAQFTGTPVAGTFPLTVNFTSTSTGSITSYAWTFGDGGTSTVANPSHVYAAAGTYTVALTVTGPGGSNTQARTNYISVTPPAPVAQFTGTPVAGTFPLTVNFTSTSSGSITSYAWTFGDGGTSTVANPSHVYAAAGTFTVALTVTGPGGSNTQTRTNYISVTPPAPVAQFTGTPVAGTFPLTVNFTSTSSGSITSYAWTFGDGGTSTLASPSHIYAAAGTYTVALTVTGPGGSNTQTRTNYITASAAAPVAQFTGTPTSGTFPLTVVFSNTSTGSITSYAWTFGDGGTSTLASPSHIYAAAGTYTVALTVTGPGGSNTQTRTNYITASAAAPVAQFTGTPTSGTFPLTVVFSNTSTGSITSYAWTFGDGGTSTLASPSHIYAAAGTYTVALTVTGPGGSNTQTRTNYITASAAAPVAQFTGTPTSGTFPLTVVFSNTSTGSITSYAWTFGDGGTSTLASPSHIYAAAGTYTVALTVTGPGGSNTQTRTNYITASTAAPVAQFTGTPTSGTVPLTVVFSNTSTGSITSYAWTFGDGGTSTLASPSHIYAAAGTYTVALTVTGPGGSNTQTRTNYITASAAAPVAQFTGTPTSGTFPLTVVFSNTSTGSITSYAWTFGDGGTSTLASPSHIYAAAGTYTVALTVTGPGGSNTQTRTNYISVTPPAPVAQFTGTPVAGKFPLTVNFTSTSTGSITSYAWTFGDGGTSTVANPSHVYAAAGTYTVALTVTGPGGSNTHTRTNYISVTPPAPVAQFTGTPVAGKFPLTVNFTSTSTGSITSYAWTFGDGGTSTVANPSHVYAAAGTYTVALTVTGPGGSNTQTRTNYISVTPPAPVAQFTGTPLSGNTPLTVNFTSTSTGSITSYAWTFGDATTSPVANPSHVFSTAGLYTISLTVLGPGGSNTQTRTSYINAGWVPPDIGLYRKTVPGTGAPKYTFLLDFNFDHIVDVKMPYGTAGDVPLTGDVAAGGKASLIAYRNGLWYIDNNRDGIADQVPALGGVPGDVPLTANFTGSGATNALVIYRGGTWFVDQGLNGTVDNIFHFGGVPGDIPLAADVNGDGIADLVIYRNGVWYVDTHRAGNVDAIYYFGGLPQDIPLLFDWDGDGKADLCIYRDGTWYINTARDGTLQSAFIFGATGDVPVVGRFH